MALACGYAYAADVGSAEGLAHAMGNAADVRGPALIHARIAPGSMAKLGRPTVKPPEVAERFRAFLARKAAAPRAVA